MPPVSAERCTRCLQPIRHSAKRCPHCGEMLTPGERKMSVWLAVALTAMILVVVVASLIFLNPPVVDTDNQVDHKEQGPPAQPAKKPVLD